MLSRDYLHALRATNQVKAGVETVMAIVVFLSAGKKERQTADVERFSRVTSGWRRLSPLERSIQCVAKGYTPKCCKSPTTTRGVETYTRSV